MYTTTGWARTSKGAEFEKIQFQRNSGGPEDVTFKLKYCGVCHSDVHIANDDLGGKTDRTKYIDIVKLLNAQASPATPVFPATSWPAW